MAVQTKFKKLLEPGRIGAVPVKNHIARMGALPGMVPSEDGLVQQACGTSLPLPSALE